MAKKKIKYKYKPSNKPFYMTGLLWIFLSFFFSMTSLSSYMIMAGICLLAYAGMRKFKIFKDRKIPYEEQISYQEMELDEILNTGSTYIQSISSSKKSIQNKEVQNDIDEIVRISKDILEEVKNDPKDVKKIRKFISYYLPMVDKMIKSYITFEKTSTSSQVQESKVKIENMLKTTQKAFISLFDSLHEDEASDISADMTVLETMMTQEGYLDK